MPGSVEAENDDAKAALAELLAAGYGARSQNRALLSGRKPRPRPHRPGNGFVALLAILVIVSIAASMVALAATQLTRRKNISRRPHPNALPPASMVQ